MPLTAEQRDAIAEELKQCFESRYGEAWTRSLHKPLRPSPLKQIAQQHGVSVSEVRKIRSYWKVAGDLLVLADSLLSPIDESPTLVYEF